MFDNFSKTTLLGIVMSVVGFLKLIGIDLPLDEIEAAATSLFDSALALYLLVTGPIIMWFRMITSTPVAKGLKGFFGIKGE